MGGCNQQRSHHGEDPLPKPPLTTVAQICVVGGLALAFVSQAVGAAAASQLVIRVQSNTTSGTLTHHSPAGPRNDVVVEHDMLVNAKQGQFGQPVGAPVGSDVATITYRTNTRLLIRATASLPGGTILVAGVVTVKPGRPTVVPVVGGTGTYAGATGTETIGTSSASPLNTYRLSIP
jgi:hypothetical protein